LIPKYYERRISCIPTNNPILHQHLWYCIIVLLHCPLHPGIKIKVWHYNCSLESMDWKWKGLLYLYEKLRVSILKQLKIGMIKISIPIMHRK